MHYLYGNSDRCQPCVRCMEGVCNSEGPLWEVPLYTHIVPIMPNHKGVCGNVEPHKECSKSC